MNEHHRDESKSIRRTPDRSHDLQLLRDLQIINERTRRELGPLPPGGLPVEPKRKPDIQRINPPRGAAGKEDDVMRISHAAAATMIGLAGALAACKVDNTAQGSTTPTYQDSGMDSSDETVDHRVDDIMRDVMKEQYGDKYDPHLDCWRHSVETNDDVTNYCMRAGDPHLVSEGDGTKLYFMSYGQTDSAGSDEYSYSHNDPGLMGAFVVALETDGTWSIQAASREMEFGSVGDCGCKDARFSRVGKSIHGWLFTTGGTWQGFTSVYYSLVTPYKGRFEDISRIPLTRMDNGRLLTHEVMVDHSDRNLPMFPLIISVPEDDDAHSLTIEFDPVQRAYSMEESNSDTSR